MNDLDRQVNREARWVTAEDPDGPRGYVDIAGVLIFVYFEDGQLVISPHFDTADARVLTPQQAVPVLVKDGIGGTVWEAP